MKTFKLTVTEDEVRALIRHHANSLTYTGSMNGIGEMDYSNYSTETSERIHNLTKRVNKDTPEIEGAIEPSQATAAKDEQQTGW